VLKITKTTSNRNNVVDCPSFAPVIWWASDLAAAIITTVRDAVPGSAAERDLQMIHQATGCDSLLRRTQPAACRVVALPHGLAAEQRWS
jgi:hypothetical protein